MPGPQIQKIITICSSILFFGIFIHLIGVYIYEGGHYEGIRGGSLSIGIVDTTPDALNPLSFGNDDSADFIYRFLFRGLLRYDTQSGSYQGDIAYCDMSDTLDVKCTLNDTAIWSDGSPIQTDDVIASINAYKKNATNPDMVAFFKGLSLKKNDKTIEIVSTTKSPHLTELLTYPIMRTDVVAAIEHKSLTGSTYVTSGPYRFGETATDTEYGFDRITLIRNEHWRSPIWLDKIHFKFFKDLTALERSKETLSIIIPPLKNENLDLGARFRESTYTKTEYFSIFLNTRTMNRSVRNSLHWNIGNTLGNMIEPDHRAVSSLFETSTGKLLPTNLDKSFPDVIRELGYHRKADIIREIQKINTTVSGEVQFSKPKYWTNSNNVDTLFIQDQTGVLLLSGKVPQNTKTVSVNGYKLQEFEPGNPVFVYRVSAQSGSLREGKNTYNLDITLSGEKTDSGSLNVYWSTTEEGIQKYKKEVQDIYVASQNTPALIAERERTKNEALQKAGGLSDEYYYNDKNEIFHIDIAYIVGAQSTESYALGIEKTLKLLGIQTNLIPYTQKDIENIIKTGKKEYDLLIIGISIDGNSADLGQLFSSNSKNKSLNFSNIENRTLDDLFSNLQSATEKTKIESIEGAIAKIMQSESFFIPIASPYHKLYIDRNIKRIPQINTIPAIPSLMDVLSVASIKENYIHPETKTFGGFLPWLFGKL